MFGDGSGFDQGQWAVLLTLTAFGVGYNALITRAGKRGWLRGFTWLAVVIGVSITLIGTWFIDARAALIASACFAASGIPVAMGAISRYVLNRERDIEELKAEAFGDDPR